VRAVVFAVLIGSFATAPSRPFPKQSLNLSWGRGAFVTERVVDKHIVTLRTKIEPERSRPR
jgi:DNA-binding response OmpR family regulator